METYIKTITLPEDVKDRFRNQDLITIDELIGELDDVLYELKSTKEELEEKEEYYQSNYKPRWKDEYQLYGVSEKDFI